MSKKLPKSGEGVPMVAADARRLIWELGEPGPGRNQKGILATAARKLGWEFSRTANMYRGRARIISAEEWIKLNQEAAEMAQREKARREALHANDLLARDAVARFAAASHRALVGPADGLGDAEVEPAAEQGGARPDLLKRKRYWAG